MPAVAGPPEPEQEPCHTSAGPALPPLSPPTSPTSSSSRTATTPSTLAGSMNGTPPFRAHGQDIPAGTQLPQLPRPILRHNTVRVSSPLRRQVELGDEPSTSTRRPALKQSHSASASFGGCPSEPAASAVGVRRGRSDARVAWAQTVYDPAESREELALATGAFAPRSGALRRPNTDRPATVVGAPRLSRSLSQQNTAGPQIQPPRPKSSMGLWGDLVEPEEPMGFGPTHPSTAMPGFPTVEFSDLRAPTFSREALRKGGVILPTPATRQAGRATPQPRKEVPPSAGSTQEKPLQRKSTLSFLTRRLGPRRAASEELVQQAPPPLVRSLPSAPAATGMQRSSTMVSQPPPQPPQMHTLPQRPAVSMPGRSTTHAGSPPSDSAWRPHLPSQAAHFYSMPVPQPTGPHARPAPPPPRGVLSGPGQLPPGAGSMLPPGATHNPAPGLSPVGQPTFTQTPPQVLQSWAPQRQPPLRQHHSSPSLSMASVQVTATTPPPRAPPPPPMAPRTYTAPPQLPPLRKPVQAPTQYMQSAQRQRSQYQATQYQSVPFRPVMELPEHQVPSQAMQYREMHAQLSQQVGHHRLAPPPPPTMQSGQGFAPHGPSLMPSHTLGSELPQTATPPRFDSPTPGNLDYRRSYIPQLPPLSFGSGSVDLTSELETLERALGLLSLPDLPSDGGPLPDLPHFGGDEATEPATSDKTISPPGSPKRWPPRALYADRPASLLSQPTLGVPSSRVHSSSAPPTPLLPSAELEVETLEAAPLVYGPSTEDVSPTLPPLSPHRRQQQHQQRGISRSVDACDSRAPHIRGMSLYASMEDEHAPRGGTPTQRGPSSTPPRARPMGRSLSSMSHESNMSLSSESTLSSLTSASSAASVDMPDPIAEDVSEESHGRHVVHAYNHVVPGKLMYEAPRPRAREAPRRQVVVAGGESQATRAQRHKSSIAAVEAEY